MAVENGGSNKNSSAHFDIEVFQLFEREWCRASPQISHRLLNLYLSTAKKYVEEMQECVRQSNASGLKRGAHALKSSSASIGVVILSKYCAELELSHGDSEVLAGLFSVIIKEYEVAMMEIAGYLKANEIAAA